MNLILGNKDKTGRGEKKNPLSRPSWVGEALGVESDALNALPSGCSAPRSSHTSHCLTGCGLSGVRRVFNMYGTTACEKTDWKLMTPTLLLRFHPFFLKLWHGSADYGLRWIEKDWSDISKSKILRHKYFIGLNEYLEVTSLKAPSAYKLMYSTEGRGTWVENCVSECMRALRRQMRAIW